MERQLSGDTCLVDEGAMFDLDEMWGDNCTRVCTLPCQDFNGLLEIPPDCFQRETGQGTCGLHSACLADGCGCELENMREAYQLNDTDFGGVDFKCSNESMAVYIGKFFYLAFLLYC